MDMKTKWRYYFPTGHSSWTRGRHPSHPDKPAGQLQGAGGLQLRLLAVLAQAPVGAHRRLAVHIADRSAEDVARPRSVPHRYERQIPMSINHYM